ncbi:class I adenylate-forming enzyme family protein [Streptomyces palmae]|uniref:Long-chain fatty acid--CoA ligase n=1 Tax=Streptomyces palmae TaxID=1701085 RepID=A0A4Z0HB68_9ACTN|nr:class I adenylate-forming enzyme family protein [Streptomyces palmae]TGB07010.1 long-chain fatty acid--CoA ligase [Streptomyces palmae]
MKRNSKPPKNIGVLFDWHAEKTRSTSLYLDRPFDIAPSGGVDYDAAALAGLVADASGWLYAAGVRRGDRIAVIKDNHFDVIMLSAAATRIGAIAATISAANRPAHLFEMLQRLQPVVTVISARTLEAAARDGVDLSAFGRTILLGEAADDSTAGTPLEQFYGSPIPKPDLRPDSEPMMITHTSGTTSTPKLVVHTAETNWGAARLELLPLPGVVNRRDDVCLCSIAFGHSRAYTWAMAQFYWAPQRLLIGGTHDPKDIEGLLEFQRPTTVEAMPNVFQHWVPLVRRRPELFARVRYYLNTFDMMHPAIARPFMNASRRRGVIWGHSWGQSEVGPIAGTAYTRRMVNKIAGSVNDNMNNMGWAWPGLMKVKIVDPKTFAPVRQGETGVVLTRGKSLFVDYLGETDRYEAKKTAGWWNTGDVGYQDRLGRIHFVDRALDSIPGSSATEIEGVLLERLEGAREVVLLSRGDRPPVPVVCLDSGTLSDEAWNAACAGLPPMADPISVEWVAMPRTSTWKIRRKELRELVLADDDTELEERFT